MPSNKFINLVLKEKESYKPKDRSSAACPPSASSSFFINAPTGGLLSLVGVILFGGII